MAIDVQNYTFTVDAELLRELGERLVGRPHMALAELIKNSYDADATHVEIWYTGEQIEVLDDGHGMSRDDFVNRWMRLGTTKKRLDRFSPGFGRPLTGSKGVGRLAVQILSHETVIRSRTADSSEAIEASVDWRSVKAAQDLDSVRVRVKDLGSEAVFANDSLNGTSVLMNDLVDNWTASTFADVAQEVWALRPPFAVDSAETMSVSLYSNDSEIEATFDRQMTAILDIWNGKITGRLLPKGTKPAAVATVLNSSMPVGEDEELTGAELEPSVTAGEFADRFMEVTLEIRGAESHSLVVKIPQCLIDEVSFEIRTFDLQNRQPRGIRVGEARSYLRRFGGVGIYDTGFRLPYYGADQDWLSIERDHARRLSRSSLLPSELQVDRGLLDLPPNSRLFGWVNVSTGHEEATWVRRGLPARHALSIQVTRDRLVNNAPYLQLRTIVRTALDLYAMDVARVKTRDLADRSKRTSVRSSQLLGSLGAVVESVREFVPEPMYGDLRTAVKNATRITRENEAESQQYASLLGALATAGSTSLAYEHEISKQVQTVRAVLLDLRSIEKELVGHQALVVQTSISRLESWLERTTGIRAVFGALLSKENRERVEEYNARRVIRKITNDLEPLIGNVPMELDVPASLKLPPATLPAWSSIFQNLIINAHNALSETDDPLIRIVGTSDHHGGQLAISDNGAGVDLSTADDLWRPFERKLQLDPAREAAGLGGLGLGLTIVRMIGDQVGIQARFMSPDPDMETKVVLKWKDVSTA